MSIIKKSVPFSFEAKADGQEGEFTAYASTFGNVDHHGDIVDKGAFNGLSDISNVKMLWQHEMSEPIGIWKSYQVNSKGLLVTGQLILSTTKGRDCYELMKAGAIKDLSIGYNVKAYEVDKSKTFKTRWGDTQPVRRLTDLSLVEISAVTIPANPKARITRVKSEDGEGFESPSIRQLEHYLIEEFGLKRREAKGLLDKGYSYFDAMRDAGSEGEDAMRDAGSDEVKQAIQILEQKLDDSESERIAQQVQNRLLSHLS